jgi:hypothetical protein
LPAEDTGPTLSLKRDLPLTAPGRRASSAASSCGSTRLELADGRAPELDGAVEATDDPGLVWVEAAGDDNWLAA